MNQIVIHQASLSDGLQMERQTVPADSRKFGGRHVFPSFVLILSCKMICFS